MTDVAALMLTTAGILAMLVVGPVFGMRHALGAMLDLWMAAGLLRIGEHRSYSSLAVAAILVSLRKMVAVAFARRLRSA